MKRDALGVGLSAGRGYGPHHIRMPTQAWARHPACYRRIIRGQGASWSTYSWSIRNTAVESAGGLRARRRVRVCQVDQEVPGQKGCSV